jgi:NAD(P)-dependent dehydrogenase (short-subunit alcohol dehydrogenase family)
VDLGLRDRVCVVTGSTGGIGRAVARMLAEEGAQVVTSGRSAAPSVGEALHVAGDLAAADAPTELIRQARELGPIDCLVNNVGLAYQTDFDAVTDAQWDKWKAKGVTHVLVLADLPGAQVSKPGSQDARRLILPLDECTWAAGTKALKVQVQRSGMVVLTPMRPTK